MGEAKKRGVQADRVATAKEQTVGDDPFSVAYDAIFGMVEAVYKQTGGVNHQLLGLGFKDGKVNSVNSLPIEDQDALARVPVNIERMLLKWSLVAHVFEAWEAPPDRMKASEHPDRKDIVSIMIHSMDAVMTAGCLVNEAERTVYKAELLAVEKIGGRLGREFETRH